MPQYCVPVTVGVPLPVRVVSAVRLGVDWPVCEKEGLTLEAGVPCGLRVLLPVRVTLMLRGAVTLALTFRVRVRVAVTLMVGVIEGDMDAEELPLGDWLSVPLGVLDATSHLHDRLKLPPLQPPSTDMALVDGATITNSCG